MEQVTALTQLVRQALRGRLDVFALDNKVSYQDGQTYTILTAVNGIEGTFSEAISKSIFLTTSLDHQVNKVDLKIGLVADPIDDVVFEKWQNRTMKFQQPALFIALLKRVPL
ncbi:hypothetical protein HGG75_25225 [Ochrobactrum pseudogrignonense]|nr:hypothetical protein [Brucella pseudogrignonensis]